MAEAKLYKPNDAISPERPRSSESVRYGSLQKEILVRAMCDAYSADTAVASAAVRQAVRYTQTENGPRTLQYEKVTSTELQTLLQNFRENPKLALATVRVNLINIARDASIPEEERKPRLERYLRAFIELIPRLDQYAYPSDGGAATLEGVPGYIPDGLSDMGSEKETDPQKRTREKIRVDKKRSYEKAFPELLEAFWNLRNTPVEAGSDAVKIYLARYVMATVYRSMPYDWKNLSLEPRERSIRIDELVGGENPSSVCRHIAMETQLRLQAMGLESRLLKCRMDGVPHVANLLRINGEWYLIDTTNPEADLSSPTASKVYARKITLTEAASQRWELDRTVRLPSGTLIKKPVVYESRNDMYYRILDNEKNPAE